MSETQAVVKKGTNPASKSRWKTGSSLGMLKVPETHKGRWCDSDEANINRKLQEGWEFVNKTNFPQGEHVKRHNNGKDVKDKSEFGGATQYRELVGMMLPIEDIHGTGQCLTERDKFIQEQTKANTLSRIRAKDNKANILGGDLAAQQAQITQRMEIIE
jgi:hypothetical protein